MTQKRLALTLLVLVVAAAAVLVWLVRDSGGDVVGAGVTTAESADARVVSSAVKEDVREVAAEAATAAYSYSWETLAEDKAAARDHMTEAMQDRYDRTMAGVATTSRRDRTVVSAEVVDTALVTASPTYARVLVFVRAPPATTWTSRGSTSTGCWSRCSGSAAGGGSASSTPCDRTVTGLGTALWGRRPQGWIATWTT
jgi:hypothetical protein